MKKTGLNQLRETFLRFYVEKDHYRRKSFSLIPEKDQSLLLINSGMAPLKPYFSGAETPPGKRMATCQKCIRTGDIDTVGLTARHGTFFEMLGSFSFGDYFKRESLLWGWEFLIDVLKMPEEKLWASVYEEDDEAFAIWKDEIGLPAHKIVRLGKADNFWEIGTGPCGPCSEVYFDRGERWGCDNPDCKPGCACDRYVEFWNHVFTQFNRDEAGQYTKLQHPNIDTGLGLERLACIMQDTDSIFEIDTIRSILEEIAAKAGVRYTGGPTKTDWHSAGEAEKTDISLRVVTDHIRSVVFLIADGVIPGNEGRGYVLRRLLRRASRHGKLLGIRDNFLRGVARKVIDLSVGAYPELEERRTYINKIIQVEEERFSATIDQGNAILAEYTAELKRAGETVLPGAKAFLLYDTFGFPLELTQEILAENGYSADADGFDAHMARQKETARAARKVKIDAGWSENETQHMFDGATAFTGHDKVVDTAQVEHIFVDNKPVAEIGLGDTAHIVLNQTPFYAESGGQAADIGMIYNDNCGLEVLDVQKFQNLFLHKVKVHKGAIQPGDEVICLISAPHRNSVARNHTATHLLHKALCAFLGDHVRQAGSSVTPDGLRFDFSHFDALSKADLETIEEMVNDKINHFLQVDVKEMPLEEALQLGAAALFGEKYEASVRVVSVGDFCMELCGGTHVANAGQIGAFKITGESGVAAGVRRIEALTGPGVLRRLNEEEARIKEAAEVAKTTPAALVQRIAALTEENKTLRKEREEAKRQEAGSAIEQMVAEAKVIQDVKLITQIFSAYDINDLRRLSDDVKAQHKAAVLVLASEKDGKVTFLVSVTDDLLEKGYHAGQLVKKIATAAGGSGGGKADMAQAGAKDASKIGDAFAAAEEALLTR